MRTVGPTVAQDNWSILVSPASLHPQPFSFSAGGVQWPWGLVIYQRPPPSRYLQNLGLHGPKLLCLCSPRGTAGLVVAAGGSKGREPEDELYGLSKPISPSLSPPPPHTHTVSLDEGNVVFGDWVAGKLEPYVKLGYIKVQRI